VSTTLIIAIDGPAGSGKSTLGNALASRLALETLDTGASYRALAAAVLEAGIDPNDRGEVARFARDATIDPGRGHVINGKDYSARLRAEEVNQAVSVVAAIPEVREVLVGWQRRWVLAHGGGVVEGRDIGTVVFPDATIKLFLTAHPKVRARRRSLEGLASIERRDRLDSTRVTSPLGAAEDSWSIDTTALTVEDIVTMVIERLESQKQGSER
jgi:cytidylate kinase